jgi:hypothetical protein
MVRCRLRLFPLGADLETADLKGLFFGEILPIAIPEPVMVGQAKLGMSLEKCGHRRFRGKKEEKVRILPFRPDAEQALHVESRRRHTALDFIYVEELLGVHGNSGTGPWVRYETVTLSDSFLRRARV